MKITGFLPVRGGSKSIPLKNIKYFLGRPLLFWNIDELIETCDEVYVYTDSKEIANRTQKVYSTETEVKIMNRPGETATDEASSESALIDFCEKVNAEIIVFAQATSPLNDAKYIIEGIKSLNQGYDSSLSVVEQKRFLWKNEKKVGIPTNYEPTKRPRRQEFDGFLVENGAFYISKRNQILKSKCRISGKVSLIKMPEDTYYEIDEPSDWIIVEELLKQRLLNNKKMDKIELLVLDIDGVFTDGGMYYSEKGESFKKFNTKDGMGLELARNNGIDIAVITSEESKINQKRMDKLSLKLFYQGISDKYHILRNITKEKDINFSNIAYVGDDINDISCLLATGISFTPKDAEKEAKKYSDFILTRSGGEGAIREAVEKIIDYNSRLTK